MAKVMITPKKANFLRSDHVCFTGRTNFQQSIGLLRSIPPEVGRKKPPTSETGKRVNQQEYWDHYYDHEHFAYEWNRTPRFSHYLREVIFWEK